MREQFTGSGRGVLSRDEIAAAVAPIARRYGVPRVYLCGSYARGEAAPESDVNLCIERGRIRDYFELGNFEADLERVLGKAVHAVTMDPSPGFFESIEDEAVAIYEDGGPSPDEEGKQ